MKDLQPLGTVTVAFKDKTGEHKGTGVRLDKVLLKQGFAEGPVGRW